MRKISWLVLSLAFALPAAAQAPGTAAVTVPDWALPDSPTHRQVAPPPDFHRDTVTLNKPIGIFENQSDVGGPLVPGDASYDAASRAYSITSAGYNIWYSRDEFRFLWKKMSGDVSLSASVDWPKEDGFGDRKVVLIIRENLDDDSRQIMAAQHGAGMVHIAWRPEKSALMTDVEYRSQRQPIAAKGERGAQILHPGRIGLEKKGDQFQLYVSWQGEPLHAEGAPVTFKADGPFLVGIGFTSHLPATTATAKLRDVVLENQAGRIR
jgi:hypothetical protein